MTFATNENTSGIIQQMASQNPESPLRILLETDAPFMIPANIYTALDGMKGRLPLSHSAMIPWTADFVAGLLGEGWDSEKVLQVGRENARRVYGV